MRKFALTILFIFISGAGFTQRLSLDDLLNLTMLSSKKTDHFLSKKGFSRSFASISPNKIVYTFQPKKKLKRKKAPSDKSTIEKYQEGRIYSLVFRTTSDKEYGLLRDKLEKEGFTCTDTTSTALSFRKNNATVLLDTLFDDSDTLYSFRVTKKKLPLLSQIKFANDLLQFDSHSDLVAVFGESNLQKDFYYFTEK